MQPSTVIQRIVNSRLVYVLVLALTLFLMMSVSFMYPTIDIVPVTIKCLDGTYNETDQATTKYICKTKMEYLGLDTWRIQQGTKEYTVFSNSEKHCIEINHQSPGCYRFKQEEQILNALYALYNERHNYLKTHQYPTFTRAGECLMAYVTRFDLNCSIIPDTYKEPSSKP